MEFWLGGGGCWGKEEERKVQKIYICIFSSIFFCFVFASYISHGIEKLGSFIFSTTTTAATGNADLNMRNE